MLDRILNSDTGGNNSSNVWAVYRSRCSVYYFMHIEVECATQPSPALCSKAACEKSTGSVGYVATLCNSLLQDSSEAKNTNRYHRVSTVMLVCVCVCLFLRECIVKVGKPRQPSME